MTTHRTSKRRLAAGTAVVLAAMLTATACGGNDTKKDEGKAGASGFNAGIGKVSNASDKKGGELKFVATQEADSWDPQRGYYGFMWDFARYYTRQLVSFKPAPPVARARSSFPTSPPARPRSATAARPTSTP
ncbi:hypothetical protein GCM10020254_28990 [Streptomyces goshikiensis]